MRHKTDLMPSRRLNNHTELVIMALQALTVSHVPVSHRRPSAHSAWSCLIITYRQRTTWTTANENWRRSRTNQQTGHRMSDNMTLLPHENGTFIRSKCNKYKMQRILMIKTSSYEAYIHIYSW